MAIVSSFEEGMRARELGATMLQVRAPGRPVRLLESAARRLVVEAGLPVLVSSRADVALATGAAGVNLPGGDIPVASARTLLGRRATIGCSVHDVESARSAADAGATLVIFGPVFETPTHPGQAAVGLVQLERVAAAVAIPVLAIGGVDGARVGACLAAGAAGHAAIRMYR